VLIEGVTNCAHIREYLHCGVESEIVGGAEARTALTPHRQAVRGELACTITMKLHWPTHLSLQYKNMIWAGLVTMIPKVFSRF
jgi:hypothetical protein